jgi:hypothetical protein
MHHNAYDVYDYEKNGDKVTFLVQDTFNKELVTVPEVQDMYENLPEGLKRGLDVVYLNNDQHSPTLGYYSPSEPGSIVVTDSDSHFSRFPRASWQLKGELGTDFTAKDSFQESMAHEAGHNLYRNMLPEDTFSKGGDKGLVWDRSWKKAMKEDVNANPFRVYSGESFVSDYSARFRNDIIDKNNEDFAESCAGYVLDHDQFAQDYPNRAAFMDKAFSKYAGLDRGAPARGERLFKSGGG